MGQTSFSNLQLHFTYRYAFTMDIAIYKAVESNEPEVLKQLIKRGADVNEFYQDLSLISAKSILHICCEKGRFDCVKVIMLINICMHTRLWYLSYMRKCHACVSSYSLVLAFIYNRILSM